MSIDTICCVYSLLQAVSKKQVSNCYVELESLIEFATSWLESYLHHIAALPAAPLLGLHPLPEKHPRPLIHDGYVFASCRLKDHAHHLEIGACV